MLDVREMIRRLRLGDSARRIARDLGLSRKTVARYQQWAFEQGLLSGALPEPAELQTQLASTLPEAEPPRVISRVAPLRDRVVELRQQGVECKAIYQRLVEEHSFGGSYSAVWRFVRKLEPRAPKACIRIETQAGEEAQVDFGYAGKLFDPRSRTMRKAWAFVMTLSYSRHSYVELVFDQEVATWLRCHRHAFEWFGGVPARLKIDNLKAAIAKACFHDPVVQRGYRECAEHYGFLISPCRPRTPQHKGKVEQGGVHYFKRNFLAGRSFRDIHEANRLALVWCVETAGQRIHGTTKQKPLERFERWERQALLPLPAAPYALAVWKQVKLHPDCHVVFEGAFYSAPHRLIGKKLWLRAADSSVSLFYEHELVGSHPRAGSLGKRFTLKDHLPPAKIAGWMACPASCLRRAQEIGPQTAELIGRLLGERPVDRLRSALGILRLAHKYSPRRLEAACTRALAFDEIGYGAIKRILERGLDLVPLRPPVAAASSLSAQPLLFVRPWTDFFPSA